MGMNNAWDSDERQTARLILENRFLKSSGTIFEELFSKSMESIHKGDFQRVKPYGNQGDRKCDGVIKNSGTYFQVYSPEQPEERVTAACKKAKEDFSGLTKYWSAFSEVSNYQFVFNDKFFGSPPELHKTISEISTQNGLKSAVLYLPKDIINDLLAMSKDDVIAVTGFIPNAANVLVGHIALEDLASVITHLLSQPISGDTGYTLDAPAFAEKIKFNGLSPYVSSVLTAGSIHTDTIEKYFQTKPTAAKELVRDFLARKYANAKSTASLRTNANSADRVFWSLVDAVSEESASNIRYAVFGLLAYYFESCDVFDSPMAKT